MADATSDLQVGASTELAGTLHGDFRGRQGEDARETTQRPPEAEAPLPGQTGMELHHILQGAGAGSTRAPSPRATGRTDHRPNRGHTERHRAPPGAWRADNGLR